MITGFAFTKLHVADLPAMERFYCGCLGFTVTARVDIGADSYNLEELILAVPGGSTQLNLLHYRGRPVPPAGEAVIGFTVADLDAALAAIVAAGGMVTVEPTAIPEHQLRLAYVADPEGHTLELLQYGSA